MPKEIMKSYFINIDFYGVGFNKFVSTIVQANLNKTSLYDVAKGLVREQCESLNLSADDVTINVKAFNEILFDQGGE